MPSTAIYEGLDIPVVGLNDNGCIVVWNPCMVHCTRYSKVQVMGKVFADLLAVTPNCDSNNNSGTKGGDSHASDNDHHDISDDVTTLQQLIQDAKMKKSTVPHTIEMLGNDSRVRQLLLNVSPIKDDHISVLIMVTDVTDRPSTFPLVQRKGRRRRTRRRTMGDDSAMSTATSVATPSDYADEDTLLNGYYEDGDDDEDMFTLSANTIPVPMFGIAAAEGIIDHWNSHMTKITGHTQDQVMGMNFVGTLVQPSSKQQTKRLFNRCLNMGRNTIIRTILQTRDGSSLNITLKVVLRRRRIPNNDEQQQQQQQQQQSPTMGVFAFCEVHSDDMTSSITNSKTPTTATLESPVQPQSGRASTTDDAVTSTTAGTITSTAMYTQEFVNTLLQTSYGPVFGVDKYGCINLWNDPFAELLGAPMDYVEGESLIETFIEPSTRQAVENVLESIMDNEQGIVLNYEMEFVTESGATRLLLVNLVPRKNASGDIYGLIGFAKDLLAPNSAIHSNFSNSMDMESRNLIDTLNAPIFGLNMNGRINEWNYVAAELTGFTKDEVIGQVFLESFVDPNFRDSMETVLAAGLEGRGSTNFELAIWTKENTSRILLVNVTPRQDVEENVVGILALAQDITETSAHNRAVE